MRNRNTPEQGHRRGQQRHVGAEPAAVGEHPQRQQRVPPTVLDVCERREQHHPRRAAQDCADLTSARLDLLTIVSSGLAADRALVERCWDLGPLNREYERFVRAQRQNLARYRRGHLDGATAAAHRIRLLNEYRGFPARDPGLPPELQPAGWLGTAARELFLTLQEVLREPAEQHYDEVVARYASAAEPLRGRVPVPYTTRVGPAEH